MLFEEAPDKYEEALNICIEESEPDYHGQQRVFTDVVCQEIRSKEIIGYAMEPYFIRSIRLKRLSSLEAINRQWKDDVYINATDIDDGYIIVEITYDGSQPEEVDEIIRQIVEKN